MTPVVRHARLAIVGTGALGSELCRLLIERRAEQVLLIDPDSVCARNLGLSALFRKVGAEAIGKRKVELIQGAAARDGLRWQAIPNEVADVGLTRLRSCDVLISCTDSALARVETAQAARMLGLPMLDGAVRSDGLAEGRVTWFASASAAACYFCGLPEARRADLLAYALSPSLGCTAPVDPRNVPMTGTLSAVQAVARQMMVWLEMVWLEMAEMGAGPAAVSRAVRMRAQAGTWQREHIELSRSAACPWHDFAAPEQMISLEDDRPIRAQIHAGEALDLPWPICLHAQCMRCGVCCTPMRRVAAVRRNAVCPGCGPAGRLEVLEAVQTIRAQDAAAGQTPRQLGLPPGHLYHRRRTLDAARPSFPGEDRARAGTGNRR